MKFTFMKEQVSLFHCLTNAFKVTGGVSKEIWFDNQKAVVDRTRLNFGKAVFNETFQGYANDAGFTPIACRPFRPKTKGKVKTLAKVTSRLVPYNNEIIDPQDLALLVENLYKKLNHAKSRGTNRIPIDLWPKEKEHLHSFDEVLLNDHTNQTIERKVSEESLVVYNNCSYSVPTRYIDRPVRLKHDNHNFCIY
jgi:hypothetical protein